MSITAELRDQFVSELEKKSRGDILLGGLAGGAVLASAVFAVSIGISLNQGPEVGGDTIDECVEYESSGIATEIGGDTDPFTILAQQNAAIDAANKQSREEFDAEEDKKGIRIFWGASKRKIGEIACLDPESKQMMLTVDGVIRKSELDS